MARQHAASADSPTHPPVLVWVRQDLRLADNPALKTAAESGHPVILVFVLPERDSAWFPGGASRWWLQQSLLAFANSLESFDQKVILRHGSPAEQLSEVARESGAVAVYANRCYEPHEQARAQVVATRLEQDGLAFKAFPGSLLVEPFEYFTKTGNPYQVFTPFWKSILATQEFADPLPVPKKIRPPQIWPESLPLEKLGLMPKIVWYEGMAQTWSVGEFAAQRVFDSFLKNILGNYQTSRDIPGETGTSRMSPYLHFGEITPRQLVHETHNMLESLTGKERAQISRHAEGYIRELGWREFAYYVLHHFPQTDHQPLREQFRSFSWEENPAWLKAWQRGQTGFPIVDAGMRELWATGWMHNRVRMIVASFLTKDLLIHWKQGADWFWDTLVDADLPSNSMGWQWTSGCGADAAPYFRVFNPWLQSKKFDPDAVYIRRWCPELADLPTKFVHEPATAPPEVLKFAKVKLGSTYPYPLVDHAERRDLALQQWEQLKG